MSGWASFPDGGVANFDASFLATRRQTWEMIGTNATIRIDDFVISTHPESAWEIRWLDLNRSAEPFETELRAERHSVCGPRPEVRMVEHISAIARSGVLEPQWPRYALLTTRVLEACVRSLGRRETVALGEEMGARTVAEL